ncbi:hypothetical protein QBC46DRAFT_375423 [Diplogelasinospora grovesii]|uniref:Secreted protein n=1 Tax=Diplogelasinospora grovesii TaxID=303347 RepID=A0AAN6NE80_9PEZI|nr:hypothetical protein QBC46DRAFT_375423 [Diplogelasinospora grovesii]
MRWFWYIRMVRWLVIRLAASGDMARHGHHWHWHWQLSDKATYILAFEMPVISVRSVAKWIVSCSLRENKGEED